MKKLLLAACLLIMPDGFGLTQSTITIGDTTIEAINDFCGSSNDLAASGAPNTNPCSITLNDL
jgi:hypothetical protein